MKKILFALLLVGAGATASFAQTSVPTMQAATPDIAQVLSFTNDSYNFGKIPFGKPVEYDVTLKNISKDSVRIENVQAGCGCTTPKWKAGPYAPGESFKITLGFNGQTHGAFQKTVTAFFNNGLSKVFTFNGETFETPADAAPASPAQKMKQAGK